MAKSRAQKISTNIEPCAPYVPLSWLLLSFSTRTLRAFVAASFLAMCLWEPDPTAIASPATEKMVEIQIKRAVIHRAYSLLHVLFHTGASCAPVDSSSQLSDERRPFPWRSEAPYEKGVANYRSQYSQLLSATFPSKDWSVHKKTICTCYCRSPLAGILAEFDWSILILADFLYVPENYLYPLARQGMQRRKLTDAARVCVQCLNCEHCECSS